MNKKGFTLIELLSVIVILAVIMAIAVPRIYDNIKQSKNDALKITNKNILRAFKEYLLNKEVSLPILNGAKIEVPLSDLVEKGYLDEVKSPLNSNNCTGYILVMRKDNDYQTIPHINCVANMPDSTTDALRTHFTFDDFSEGTINVSLNNGQTGTSPFAGDGAPSLSVIEDETKFRERKVARFRTGSAGNFYINGASKISTATNSTNWTSTLYVKRVDGTPLTTVGTYMYVANNASNDNITVTTEKVEDGWYKVTRTRTGLTSGNPTLFGIYNLGSSVEVYIADWMIEPKPYSTPYVSGSRTGSVKDYSVNNTTVSLSSTGSPRHNSNGIKNSGAYNFTNQTINFGTGNTFFPMPTFTLSAWIKTPGLGSGMSINGIVSITYGLTLYLNSSGNLNFRMDNGTSIPAITFSKNLHDNQLHHVAATFDGTNQRLYIDGKLAMTSAFAGWTGTTRWPTNSAEIGQENNNGPIYRFNGMIDDFRLYKRALGEKEIETLYELSK